MVKKLSDMNINYNIISWILEFLTCRPQFVKLNNSISEVIVTNTGAPQGCVMSPTLYTIYTNDCKVINDGTKIIKFADDSSVLGLITTSENAYRDEIARFVDWCDDNFLTVNVAKTKEVIFDFRIKIPRSLEPIHVKGELVEIVEFYKYLGLLLDDKLKFNHHVDKMTKVLNQRLYFLRKLHSFNISTSILEIFIPPPSKASFLLGSPVLGVI